MGDVPTVVLSRRFTSPVIKCWKKAEEERVLSLLAILVASFRNRETLLLDLFVAEKATVVEERLGQVEVPLRRHSPSQALCHRLGRSLGVYTYSSGLSALVRLRQPTELVPLLKGDVIWDADFIVYPDPECDLHHLPDPHLAREELLLRLPWFLTQQTGVPDWIVGAATQDRLDRMVATGLGVFAAQRVPVEIR